MVHLLRTLDKMSRCHRCLWILRQWLLHTLEVAVLVLVSYIKYFQTEVWWICQPWSCVWPMDSTFTVHCNQQKWIWIMSSITTFFLFFLHLMNKSDPMPTLYALRFTMQPNPLFIDRYLWSWWETKSSDISRQRNKWKKSPQIHFVGSNLGHCTLAISNSVYLNLYISSV